MAADNRRVRPRVSAPASVQAHSVATPPVAHTGPNGVAPGKEVENKRIRVWWPDEKRWYSGVIAAFNARKGLHWVEYDDGDEEWVDLRKERWEWRRGNAPIAASGDLSDGNTPEGDIASRLAMLAAAADEADVKLPPTEAVKGPSPIISASEELKASPMSSLGRLQPPVAIPPQVGGSMKALLARPQDFKPSAGLVRAATVPSRQPEARQGVPAPTQQGGQPRALAPTAASGNFAVRSVPQQPLSQQRTAVTASEAQCTASAPPVPSLLPHSAARVVPAAVVRSSVGVGAAVKAVINSAGLVSGSQSGKAVDPVQGDQSMAQPQIVHSTGPEAASSPSSSGAAGLAKSVVGLLRSGLSSLTGASTTSVGDSINPSARGEMPLTQVKGDTLDGKRV